MAKQIELIFENSEGRTVRLSLEAPIEPAEPSAVAQVMDQVISSNIFDSSGGDLVAKKGARIIERHMEETVIPI